MADLAGRALVASLVLVVMVGGVSLWVVAPWEGSVPGAPTSTDTSSRGPAPRYFDQTWSSDKQVIAPGEPVTISLTLKNVWDKRIEIMDFPETMALSQVDTRPEETVAVGLIGAREIPTAMESGEEVTVVANVPPDLTASLQSGRCSVRFDIRFTHTPGRPEMGDTRLGLNSGILLVVLPPEGALNTIVQVDETRETRGGRITLEAIDFTPEKTTIVALAELPADEPIRLAPVNPPHHRAHPYLRDPTARDTHAHGCASARPYGGNSRFNSPVPDRWRHLARTERPRIPRNTRRYPA